jgi:hypothetical protein
MSNLRKEAPARTPSYVSTRAFAAVIAAEGAIFAVVLWLLIAHQPSTVSESTSTGAPMLKMATCAGHVDETPEDSPWTIPLDQCDPSIEGMEIASGFLQKWTICGGADSFAISLKPRAVTVTGDHIHCSNTKSEVTVTYLGIVKN